jgi:hypothetical protein
MFATKLVNQIYHLVTPGGNHTLCGLRISRLPIGAKLPGNLQLIDTVPPSKTICKHCERIENQTKQQNPGPPQRATLGP